MQERKDIDLRFKSAGVYFGYVSKRMKTISDKAKHYAILKVIKEGDKCWRLYVRNGENSYNLWTPEISPLYMSGRIPEYSDTKRYNPILRGFTTLNNAKAAYVKFLNETIIV